MSTIQIEDVRFDYCDIDARCDKCGTVTQDLGYKYDIFDDKAEVISSVSPTAAISLDKIFGGRQVEAGEVPWQVNFLYLRRVFKLIHFDLKITGRLQSIDMIPRLSEHQYSSTYRVRIGSQYYYSFCGGVIVSTRKIISAAHCFMNDDSSLKPVDKIKVIAGHSSITSAKQTVDIEKFVLHP